MNGKFVEDLVRKAAKTLNDVGRKQIQDDNFALPGRKYPIHDISHARNALARVSQFGTDEEKAKVRTAVSRKSQHFLGHTIIAAPGRHDRRLFVFALVIVIGMAFVVDGEV